MGDIDVTPFVSCSEDMIYIIKFQFQEIPRWSVFQFYYCEIKISKWACSMGLGRGPILRVAFFKLVKTMTYVSQGACLEHFFQNPTGLLRNVVRQIGITQNLNYATNFFFCHGDDDKIMALSIRKAIGIGKLVITL